MLQGPELGVRLNPSTLKQAAALDRERKLTGKRSHLHGIPVLLRVCSFTVNSPLIFRITSRPLFLNLKVGRRSYLDNNIVLRDGYYCLVF